MRDPRPPTRTPTGGGCGPRATWTADRRRDLRGAREFPRGGRVRVARVDSRQPRQGPRTRATRRPVPGRGVRDGAAQRVAASGRRRAGARRPGDPRSGCEGPAGDRASPARPPTPPRQFSASLASAWHRALVVSEPMYRPAPFVLGEHFVGSAGAVARSCRATSQRRRGAGRAAQARGRGSSPRSSRLEQSALRVLRAAGRRAGRMRWMIAFNLLPAADQRCRRIAESSRPPGPAGAATGPRTAAFEARSRRAWARRTASGELGRAALRLACISSTAAPGAEVDVPRVAGRITRSCPGADPARRRTARTEPDPTSVAA